MNRIDLHSIESDEANQCYLDAKPISFITALFYIFAVPL